MHVNLISSLGGRETIFDGPLAQENYRSEETKAKSSTRHDKTSKKGTVTTKNNAIVKVEGTENSNRNRRNKKLKEKYNDY